MADRRQVLLSIVISFFGGMGIMMFGRPAPEVVDQTHRNGNALVRVHNSGRSGKIRASVEYSNSQDIVVAEYEQVSQIERNQTRDIEIEIESPNNVEKYVGKARVNGLLGL